MSNKIILHKLYLLVVMLLLSISLFDLSDLAVKGHLWFVSVMPLFVVTVRKMFIKAKNL